MTPSRPVLSTILVIDDDVSIGEFFSELFSSSHRVVVAHTGEEGFRKYQEVEPEAILLDVRLPDVSGVDVLERITKTSPPHPSVIMITANRDVETAVRAMKLGAFDYLLKPFGENEELEVVLEKAIEDRRLRLEVRTLRHEVKQFFSPDNMIGSSGAMQAVHDRIEKVLDNDVTVLIRGESGTGKEMVARAVHYGGRRSARPFVALNCAAIPENLLENELFGHERGAFTGAMNFRKGKFEMADTGTLFLDEIGALQFDLQAKLLRVLQEREIERVGGGKPISVDVRIVAATSRNLEEAIRKEGFRSDLFYRLNVMSITIPPLRDRREDIPMLVDHFLKKHGPKLGREVRELAHDAMRKLMDHSWPGNVRELENTIERALIYASGPLILSDQIELFSTELEPPAESAAGTAPANGNPSSLEAAESKAIVEALKNNGFNISRAAMVLGITRKTLRAKMLKFGITK
ncbi:sigma-54-dependent Fis family transcriptional regulator [bacterium]|nr:sigma-54-dependent Fis family transcriptional regulator [bacterium]